MPWIWSSSTWLTMSRSTNKRLLLGETAGRLDLLKARLEVRLVDALGAAIDQHQTGLVLGPEVQKKAISLARPLDV